MPDSPDILQLTAGEYWDLISAAYELDTKRKAFSRIDSAFDMYSHQNETIASFSHGMRQNDFDRHVAARSRYLGIG